MIVAFVVIHAFVVVHAFVVFHGRHRRLLGFRRRRGRRRLRRLELSVTIDVHLEQRLLAGQSGTARPLLAHKESRFIEDPGVHIFAASIENPKSSRVIPSRRQHCGVASSERHGALPVTIGARDQNRITPAFLHIRQTRIGIHEESNPRGLRYDLKHSCFTGRRITVISVVTRLIHGGLFRHLRRGWAGRRHGCRGRFKVLPHWVPQ